MDFKILSTVAEKHYVEDLQIEKYKKGWEKFKKQMKWWSKVRYTIFMD